MPTVGKVGTRLSQAKKFTLVDAKDAFWLLHGSLECRSSSNPTSCVHICLDPRNLNKATNWEHYQMSTLGEVETRLSQAKKFTLVGAKDGFWQKHLDTESSHKTTFNTPFGWFWWNSVPFGICSAPQVWQCTMYELWRVCKGWKW